jgi:LmbE family N-acetylglucosaminyl deacetylase
MLSFPFPFDRPDPTVMLLGAHCDDIEIGCGATIASIAAAWPQARIVWVVLSGDERREAETRAAATALLGGARGAEVRVERFRGSYFPACMAEIKDCIESLKSCAPDLVFTHRRDDAHQDHRIVSELTWNAFRDHTIVEYEIPKYDGDLGAPNVFVPLSREQLRRKCDVLIECFASQAVASGSRAIHSKRSPACAASSATPQRASPRPSTHASCA